MASILWMWLIIIPVLKLFIRLENLVSSKQDRDFCCYLAKLQYYLLGGGLGLVLSFVFLTTYGNLYPPRWLFSVRPVIKHPKSDHMRVMAVRTSNPGSKYLFLWPVIKWGLPVSLYRTIINSFILVLVRKESHMFHLSLFQLCLLWEVVLPLFFG